MFVILRVEGPAPFFFLPDFIAKTQNLSVPDPHFDEFTVLSLDNFVDGIGDEFLLCPIRALRNYLSRMEQYHPGIECLFMSTGVRKKTVSRIPISFWLRSVISFAHSSVPEDDTCELRVRAHEAQSIRY